MHTTRTAAAGRPVAGRRSGPPGELRRGASIAVPAPSDRSMGSALYEWAVVVLEAVAPGYACSGWGGPGDARGGAEERRRWSRTARHARPDGRTTFSRDVLER